MKKIAITFILITLIVFHQGKATNAATTSPVNINVNVDVNLDEIKNAAQEEAGKQVKHIKERLNGAFNALNAWFKDKVGINFYTIWDGIKEVFIKIGSVLAAIGNWFASFFKKK